MIKIFYDAACSELKESQQLLLSDSYSAMWVRKADKSDLELSLKFLMRIFRGYQCYIWLASTGGYGSSKIEEFKRAFGSWSFPLQDVCFKSDIYKTDGEKIYSDIARVTEESVEHIVGIMDRQLFGVDSSLFFIKSDNIKPSVENISKYLGGLFIERDKAKDINETLLNTRLLEKYIDQVIMQNGIATIIMKDSDMNVIIVAIGVQEVINSFKIKAQGLRKDDFGQIVDIEEISDWLKIGVSVSVLG